MSYESTRLSFSPALFYRLDMVGPATNGDTVADLSGNSLSGTVDFRAGTVGGPGVSPGDGIVPFIQPYGLASPIETDAASREFCGHNYNTGADTEMARISRSTAALIEPAGDFTLDAWIRPLRSDMGNDASDGTIKQHLVGKIGSCEIYIDHSTKLAGFMHDNAGTFFHVVDTSDFVVGESYYVAVVRIGATLALYINGFLKASTTTSGSPTRNTGGDFFIHNLQTSPADCRYDEVAFQLNGLSAANIRAIYESAKFTLPLTATLTTRVVVELDTDASIPVDFPFAHNFAEAVAGTERPLVEHLAFKTNVNQSEPDYQQRINAQPYHLERTIETAVTPINARGRAMMQAALWKPGNVYPLPVSNDWSELTSSSAVAATILNLDTRWRDYEVGSYVGVWTDVFNPATYQRFRITSVTDTQLGITPAVVTLLPTGSVAMPARLACLPEDTLALESHLIDTESAVLQFEVLATELSTRRVTAYTPAATYKSVEVFSLVRAKVEWADPVSPVSRQLVRRFSGTGNPTGNDYQRAVDTGSPQTIPLRVLCLTRQSISEFYGWLQARQGRQNPVWVVSQDNDLPVTATTATTATIPKIGYTAQYNVHGARRDVAFLKTDGTYVYKRITAAVDNGDGTETLTMAATLPSLATIARTSFLKFCTAPDVYEIHYHRAGTEFLAECAFVLTELLTTPA